MSKRFEEPLVKPLYITMSRAAELLDVPYWKIQGLSFCIGRRYFGPEGGAPRLLLTAVEEYMQLRDAGQDAARIMSARQGVTNGWSSYPPYGYNQVTSWRPITTRRRRRRRW